MKILMVCLGNICRSPLAEGILKSKLPENFIVDSAGTIDMHQGQKPDFRSIAVAEKHGIDISQQRSRPITTQDLERYDLIFCMDDNNLEDVRKMTKNKQQKEKIQLILPLQKNVPDPYYGDISDFENVFNLLDSACTILAQNILGK
jgi:protein-tyrosine phosphatase